MAKKKKTLQEQTTEELQKKKKGLKTLIGMMIGVSIVFIGLVIYYLIDGHWSTDKLPAVTSLIMLSVISMVLNKQITEIDGELANRRSQ